MNTQSLHLDGKAGSMIDLNQIEWSIEKDLWEACCHEVGHMMVAFHFGVPAQIQITPTGVTPPTLESRAYVGSVRPLAQLPPFRKAVVCWAGPMAEAAFSELDPKACLFDSIWVDGIMDEIGDGEEMSATDRAGMFGHNQVRRAAHTAARILAKRFDNVKLSAEIEFQCVAERDGLKVGGRQ